MLIDTHCHLDYPDFDRDRAHVIARAVEAGVTEMISIGTRIETSAGAIKVARSFPNVWATVGIHPLEVADAPDNALEQLRKLAMNERVVAIGEIGLDYYEIDQINTRVIKRRQADLFRSQLELAADLGLSVVFHQREAWEDFLRMIEPFTGLVHGVFHCFKGTPAQVNQVSALGHLVSFTGMATFPEMPQIAATAATIDSGLFMVETDSPFHSPAPDRKNRCEPAFARQIAEQIAKLRDVSLDFLAAQTSATARTFFKLK